MKLTVHTAGDGPRTVALIHGLAANADLWADFADLLVETGEYTVLMPDLRGHGESPRSADYLVGELVDDLVETLPAGLHSAVGHSLGGALLVRAVPRLRPAHAIYLDPGFTLGLPSKGIGARLFWSLSAVTMPVVMIASKLTGTNDTDRYSERTKQRVDAATKQFDRKMALPVFRQLTFDPTRVAAPVVPSTVVLSSEGKVVVPDPQPQQLERAGWDVRRLPEVGHPFWLHDAAATYGAIRDVV